MTENFKIMVGQNAKGTPSGVTFRSGSGPAAGRRGHVLRNNFERGAHPNKSFLALTRAIFFSRVSTW